MSDPMSNAMRDEIKERLVESRKPKNVSTYKAAGVDIDNANTFVQLLKEKAKIQTGFAATFNQGFGPLLVASTDGVGTKAHLALEYAEMFDNASLIWLGIDLVAAVFNDIITTGAKPAFMLDYYATPSINIEQASKLIDGILEGLECCEARLIGGETAEMKDTYQTNAFDLAGFGIGFLDKDKILTREAIKAGDIIIGIESSGPHTNGYTLIRQILNKTTFNSANERVEIVRQLLTPSYIYAALVEDLLLDTEVKAMAHITGGGLLENIPRSLPEGYRAVLDAKAWSWPPIFEWIQSSGNVPVEEMYRVFNLGFGYTIVIDEDDVDRTIASITHRSGHNCCVIGCVVPSRSTDNRCIVA